MSGDPGRGPAISAHRGGSEHGPGGTYEAFQDAVAAGADYVEFDVRQTRDGILMAVHAGRARLWVASWFRRRACRQLPVPFCRLLLW